MKFHGCVVRPLPLRRSRRKIPWRFAPVTFPGVEGGRTPNQDSALSVKRPTNIVRKTVNDSVSDNFIQTLSGLAPVLQSTPGTDINCASRQVRSILYTLRKVHPYLISNQSPLAVRHGDIVEARQFLFELFYQQSKTGDIVQGLPKIEQLFEARRTSLHVIETVHLRLKEKFQELCMKYSLYEAARRSIRFIQRILIDEIQRVYQSQGVDIADKHIEIIIRQMTSKVIIHEKGKSPFFPDDIIDFHQIREFELSEFVTSGGVGRSPLTQHEAPQDDQKFNRLYQPVSQGENLTSSILPFWGEKPLTESKFTLLERTGNRPHRTSARAQLSLTSSGESISSSGIIFEPVVLGLTKIAFLTQSFISAASFQETKRVLMNSALQSRVDFLYGLKENVIVGRFIRAGTGFRTSLFPSLPS